MPAFLVEYGNERAAGAAQSELPLGVSAWPVYSSCAPAADSPRSRCRHLLFHPIFGFFILSLSFFFVWFPECAQVYTCLPCCVPSLLQPRARNNGPKKGLCLCLTTGFELAGDTGILVTEAACSPIPCHFLLAGWPAGTAAPNSGVCTYAAHTKGVSSQR